MMCDNIMAGAAYLREMHDRYGDATAMLAAYNAGPGRYDDYRSRGRPLPAETRLSRPSGVDHRRARATCSLPPRRIPIRSLGGAPRCSCAWRVQPMPFRRAVRWRDCCGSTDSRAAVRQ
jgi:hypothetical protein